MPYITQEDRMKFEYVLDKFIATILTSGTPTVGEMNYLITSLIHRWVDRVGLSYINCNAAIGIMECAKMELYRRVIAPYEDIKIEENGPVSVLDYKPKVHPV